VVIVLAREDVEIHIHALETTTEHFQLCEWGIVILANCIVIQKKRGSWDAPDYPTCPRTPFQ
jgi:hypothetical protein